MLAQSSIPLNETFSYNKALKRADFCKIIKAMIVEVNDHESRSTWTQTKCWDLHKNNHEHLELQAQTISGWDSQQA